MCQLVLALGADPLITIASASASSVVDELTGLTVSSSGPTIGMHLEIFLQAVAGRYDPPAAIFGTAFGGVIGTIAGGTLVVLGAGSLAVTLTVFVVGTTTGIGASYIYDKFLVPRNRRTDPLMTEHQNQKIGNLNEMQKM